MTQTPKSIFSALAEAIRTESHDDQIAAVDAAAQYFGANFVADPVEVRTFLTEYQSESRTFLAAGVVEHLRDNEGFDGLKFLNHATDAGKPSFQYPHTPRRSWTLLAEAIRQLNDGSDEYSSMAAALNAGHRVTAAIAELPMPLDERETVRKVFMAAMREEKTRRGIATDIAAILTGREKFDVERFIHHATSDSAADDDSTAGKWSYNRTHQAEAQKTTIEAESGETVEL